MISNSYIEQFISSSFYLFLLIMWLIVIAISVLFRINVLHSDSTNPRVQTSMSSSTNQNYRYSIFENGLYGSILCAIFRGILILFLVFITALSSLTFYSILKSLNGMHTTILLAVSVIILLFNLRSLLKIIQVFSMNEWGLTGKYEKLGKRYFGSFVSLHGVLHILSTILFSSMFLSIECLYYFHINNYVEVILSAILLLNFIIVFVILKSDRT